MSDDERVSLVAYVTRRELHAPRQLQSGLDAWAMEGDQAVAVFLAEEAHPFIVERDRLDPQGGKVMCSS
jgi:hypothetical protein